MFIASPVGPELNFRNFKEIHAMLLVHVELPFAKNAFDWSSELWPHIFQGVFMWKIFAL